METIITIGLDIAKSVFQVHAVDVGGQLVIRRQLKPRYVLTFLRSCRHLWFVIHYAKIPGTGHWPWLTRLLAATD